MEFKFKISWGISLLVLSLFVYVVYAYTPEQRNHINVGATYMTMNNSFYEAINSRIESYVHEQNGEMMVRDPELSVSKQIAQIKEMISQDVETILINPVEGNNKKLINALKKAKDKGIHIIVIDAQLSNDSFVDCTIVSDNYKAGETCAENLMKRKKKANILLLKHATALSAVDRINGFKDAIKNHRSYRIIKTIETLGQTEYAMPQVEKIIEEGYSFDTIMSLNDQASLGALAAIENKHYGKRVSVYSVDGSPNMKRLISSTNLDVRTVAQSPEQMALQANKMILRIHRDQSVKKNVVVKSETIISKKNISKFNISGWQ